MTSENIAIIDIGSNSVRLFIFAIENGKPRQLSAMKHFCGLGKDLGTTGNLNPQAVSLTLDHLNVFRREIEKHNVCAELVIGTAALREAKDTAAFLDKAKSQAGFIIKIISGEEEARLAALAVLSTDRQASGLVADFGGGSLEIAKIGNGAIEKKISLRLGAHYLKALPDRKAGIDGALRAMLEAQPETQDPETLYVIGGSWRSLAKARLQKNGEAEAELEGRVFAARDIIDFCAEIEKKPPAELIETYRMEAPRAELMDVSALMLSRLIAATNARNIRVSTAGIRDGLAYDYLLAGHE